MTAEKSKYASPCTAARIRRSKYVVQPSLSQLHRCQKEASPLTKDLTHKCSQLQDVTRFPLQLWLSSCAITSTFSRSPETCDLLVWGHNLACLDLGHYRVQKRLTTVGVANVQIGFSMPTHPKSSVLMNKRHKLGPTYLHREKRAATQARYIGPTDT